MTKKRDLADLLREEAQKSSEIETELIEAAADIFPSDFIRVKSTVKKEATYKIFPTFRNIYRSLIGRFRNRLSDSGRK